VYKFVFVVSLLNAVLSGFLGNWDAAAGWAVASCALVEPAFGEKKVKVVKSN
jgi:hypothetical protein